jgi:hypothetical protein
MGGALGCAQLTQVRMIESTAIPSLIV